MFTLIITVVIQGNVVISRLEHLNGDQCIQLKDSMRFNYDPKTRGEVAIRCDKEVVKVWVDRGDFKF